MDLDALERSLAIQFPAEYRALATRGRLDPSSEGWLWLFEARWRIPRRLPLAGDDWPLVTEPLVEFARTGAGDPWCWRLASGEPLEVLECPRDREVGTRYAPNFAGFLVRRMLDFAAGGFDEFAEARTWLRRWAAELRTELRPGWVDLVREVAERPEQPGPWPALLSRADVDALVARTLGPEWVERREVRWQR